MGGVETNKGAMLYGLQHLTKDLFEDNTQVVGMVWVTKEGTVRTSFSSFEDTWADRMMLLGAIEYLKNEVHKRNDDA